jgi:hypothetical protein
VRNGSGATSTGLKRAGKLGAAGGAFILALTFGMGARAAEEPGTPEQREACTPDAMRLCSAHIPDVPKIIACMKHNYRNLSAECRAAMAKGPNPKTAERHEGHHGKEHHADRERHSGKSHHASSERHQSKAHHASRDRRAGKEHRASREHHPAKKREAHRGSRRS